MQPAPAHPFASAERIEEGMTDTVKLRVANVVAMLVMQAPQSFVSEVMLRPTFKGLSWG